MASMRARAAHGRAETPLHGAFGSDDRKKTRGKDRAGATRRLWRIPAWAPRHRPKTVPAEV